MGNTPNQDLYQTSQTFKIDIKKIYSDYIQKIDAHRSITNANIKVDTKTLSSFDAKTIAGINKSVKIEDTEQESRLHCFYRFIGFPVVDKDNKYYNPGHDIIDAPKLITLKDKINIANNPIDGFKEYSIERETYLNSIKQVWQPQPATITASVLALSSVSVRPFNTSMENTEPFKFSKGEQSYVAPLLGIIGSNDGVDLKDYVDVSGNTPDASKLFQTRYHYIKPFVVDPRIDFSCNPASRKFAVPFVPDKSKLLISENTFVDRPLIEKVVIDRFSVQNQNDLSQTQKDIRDVILSIPTIKDESLINKMSTDAYGLSDKIKFQKYLFIIAAMCKELVDAQLVIQKAQAAHYWIPLPSTNGPEGGCSVADIIISDKLPSGDNNNFITQADAALINATLTQAANNFNAQTAQINGTPDNGGFSFGEFSLTFDTDTSEAMGDMVTEQVDYLNKQRNALLEEANDALRTIEIIMGEFSGLGLCDIVAIMAALYLMPANSLLGFLDEDAYGRALSAEGVAMPSLSNPSNIETAQKDFIAKVLDFYNLMDNIYKQLKENAGQTS